MNSSATAQALRHAAAAAIAAVDPAKAVREWLTAHPLPDGPVCVIAFGKASAAMACAAAEILNERIQTSLVVSDHPVDVPAGAELIVSGHPLPNEHSVRAGKRALELTSAADDAVVLFLVSGGGSALLEAPASGVTLEDIASVTATLLRSGAPIEDMNTVRTHLSAVKGGRLAAAAPGTHLTLALSDVVGSPPHAIASGPTVPPTSAPADAIEVLAQWDVLSAVPQQVIDHLTTAGRVAVPPTSAFHVVGDGAQAASAASAALEAAGLPAVVHTTALVGEASFAAREAYATGEPGTVGVFAGETTVTVTGDGVGGRNQEAALALVPLLAGTEDVALTMGTDGIDGPTDAAGAVVDGDTHARAIAAGVDVSAALRRHDSHSALDAVGGLLRTGPTGTNVGDLWLIARM